MGGNVRHATTAAEAIKFIDEAQRRNKLESLAVVVVKLGTEESGSGIDIIAKVRTYSRQPFVAVYSEKATKSPALRQDLTDERDAHMVTADIAALEKTLKEVMFVRRSRGDCVCPVCGLSHLNAEAIWVHFSVEHSNAPNAVAACPICGWQRQDRPLASHIHHAHVPQGRRQEPHLPALPVDIFAIVVVRHPETRKYLLVQEFGRSGYWLPGGRVDGSEDPRAAALRECVEEAGVEIDLKGVLRTEFKSDTARCRLRFIFYGEPKHLQHCVPKTCPDCESVGAIWASATDLYDLVGPKLAGALKLRSLEPLEWVRYLEDGQPIQPMSVVHFGNC